MINGYKIRREILYGHDEEGKEIFQGFDVSILQHRAVQ